MSVKALLFVALASIMLASVTGCKGVLDTTEPYVDSFKSHSN